MPLGFLLSITVITIYLGAYVILRPELLRILVLVGFLIASLGPYEGASGFRYHTGLCDTNQAVLPYTFLNTVDLFECAQKQPLLLLLHNSIHRFDHKRVRLNP